MVASDPTLTEAAIRELARPQSYDRGENYYDEGAVVEVMRRGETLRAAVEGSQYEPYQVRIELDETGVVDTACSCPYDHGGICKHRVAVLLTYIRDPDEIDQRPPVSELIADTDPELLRDLLVDLVEDRPELADQVESRLETTKHGDGDAHDRTPDINRESIRQQVQYVLRPTDGQSAHAYDPYAAVETDVEKLRDLLDQARAAIDAGDGETALDILEPLADELMGEEWLALSYDDSNAIFEFFDEVDRVLAEALLTADLSEVERADWEDRLWRWENEMGGYTHHPPYSVALEAAQRGWDFEPVQRAMRGDASYADLWEGDPPWYAEEFIRARLNVLERQDRIEEYLNLAAAADLIDAYVTKLVEEGRIDEAIAIADRFSDYKVVEPVAEAVWEDHPQWTIDACKEQAEPIIEEGQSQRYRHAVDWLEIAGKAAEAAGELDEWRAYVEGLRDDHYQKYKLRPMLEELLEDFQG
ncbi:MAG: SWIM zinc finger family protein [Haloarculaceae archaeon]